MGVGSFGSGFIGGLEVEGLGSRNLRELSAKGEGYGVRVYGIWDLRLRVYWEIELKV